MKKTSKNSYLFYEFLLLLASIIWGFAFVAQRAGMEYIGPFIFNGIRFLLGTITLLPFLLLNLVKNKNNNDKSFLKKALNILNIQSIYIPGIIAGLILFLASSLQQIGIVYTKAGKAGFITGLYVVIVPLYGILLKQKSSFYSWLGASISLIGLYLLSVKRGFIINRGDIFVFLSSFLWALHVQYISHYSKKINSFLFSIIQFFITSILSIIISIFLENINFFLIKKAIIPIIYGGIFSVGIAYTLQVFGQKKAHPTHAAIILSSESLFAVIGGVLFLGETISKKELLGCILMFFAIIISQIKKTNN